eukprot:6997881-Alexandrium_andersonii.AAC.1
MSASLVGSEMCIRDSMMSPHARHAALDRTRVFMKASGQPRARGSSSRTVSYTHLTLPTICSV